MATATIADVPVEVDPEGFMLNADQWTEQIAEEIAHLSGIPELTERHWQVVRFMRERYLSTSRIVAMSFCEPRSW